MIEILGSLIEVVPFELFQDLLDRELPEVQGLGDAPYFSVVLIQDMKHYPAHVPSS